MTKKWEFITEAKKKTTGRLLVDDIIKTLFASRGITKKLEIKDFLNPINPLKLTPKDVGIDKTQLLKASTRIKNAIKKKESIVVYADYDADGITAGAVMWEALYKLGANIMPYIPHRELEGYGLSKKGIDSIKKEYNPTLIITVDQGITAGEMVKYAKNLGIEVIVTDHHVKPEKLPECITVHTIKLSGAGISWFVARAVAGDKIDEDLLAITAIGTVADMVPLVEANRSLVKYGLEALNQTKKVGLRALIKEAGIEIGELKTYDISHVIAPRLNAMGRLVHAMDALRLVCATSQTKAVSLASLLGVTNKDRQKMTTGSALHALNKVKNTARRKKLIFVSDESYNQGIIGLVAGKLVDEYYLPSVVVARGEKISKASARSIAGFNIVEAVRSFKEFLVDVGGHPMAAGFTVETKNLSKLKKNLENLAQKELTDDKLRKVTKIDMEIPFDVVNEKLWKKLQELAPFGMGNYEPVFATRKVLVKDLRTVGKDGNHLKVKVGDEKNIFDCIGFRMGKMYSKILSSPRVDIAYTIDMNYWNGRNNLQLKLREVRVSR
ncbi:single-stranded-DNA-specific exonuclease RecJ [Patescibacteria group bacterium]